MVSLMARRREAAWTIVCQSRPLPLIAPIFRVTIRQNIWQNKKMSELEAMAQREATTFTHP